METVGRRPSGYQIALGIGMVVAGDVAFGLLWYWELKREWIGALDVPVQQWMASNHWGPLDWAAMAVSTVATPKMVPFIVLGLSILWVVNSARSEPVSSQNSQQLAWAKPMVWFGSVVMSSLVVMATKYVVSRARPPAQAMVEGVDPSNSFPSGHTCVFATAALALALLATSGKSLRTRLTVFSAAIAATTMVALSRLYLGYHWLTDTCASASIALGILGVIVIITTAMNGAESTTRPSADNLPFKGPDSPAAG